MSQPEITFRHGPCSASIFMNEYDRGGETFTYRTVSFQKRYQDRNGDWQASSNLGVNDIPKACLVLQKAYEFLTSNAQIATTPQNGNGFLEDEPEPVAPPSDEDFVPY